jgi:radical SAM superfamily enzyme YgiQ (UPF0313 family)
MKVLLINPGSPRALKKENLALAYLSAVLEAEGHHVRVVDEVAGQNVDDAAASYSPDVAGISCMTMYAPRAYEIADMLREKYEMPVVMGGAHPTAMPEEALQHADCVVRGEAESAFVEVLNSGRIKGVVEAQPVMDLDSLPLPARSKLDLDFYCGAGEELAGLSIRTLGLITSRGCPFHCDFCVNSRRTSPLRFHSPERVIEEIRYIAAYYPIQGIAFYDELMASDVERFRRICEKLIQTGLNRYQWECQAHPRIIRPDLLQLMKRAGCVQVAVGFESGSQTLLDRIHKNSNVESNLDAAKRVHEAGLRLRGCFIFGTPGETPEDLRKTEDFIRGAQVDFTSIHFLTPYPGSALYEQFRERIHASAPRWEKFTTGDPDAFVCNDAIPAHEQKAMYENLAARLAFRNYSWWEMAKRAARNPRHALHVARKVIMK